jgi:ABC-type glycerol-3-phosphate transport system substrate-binding protein
MLQQFGVDNAGNIWITVNYVHMDNTDAQNPIYESTMKLVKLAPDGTESSSADLNAIEDLENPYPQSICFDKDGNAYVLCYQAIAVFDGNTGEFAFLVNENGYIQGAAPTNSGDIVMVISGGQGGYSIKTIDYAARAATPAKAYSGGKYFNDVYQGAGEYTFFFRYQNSLYGFKLADMSDGEVINFINSDIDGNNISRLVPAGDGVFLMNRYSFGDAPADTGLVKLTHNPDATLTGRKIITFGALSLDDIARRAILSFNKSHTDARITVTEYVTDITSPDAYEKAATALDLAIVSGRAPDILSLNGLQLSKYAKKGALLELSEYIDNSPNIKREDLFENILTAGSPDGGIYRIIPSFSIHTLVCSTSILDGKTRLTAAEMAELTKKYPEAALTYGIDANTWLWQEVAYGLEEYVDWNAGTCSFDSQRFIDELELSKSFPETFDWNAVYDDYLEYENNYSTMFREGRTLFEQWYFNDVRAARSARDMFGGDVAFVGFPAAGGSGSVIMPQGDFAISASSENKELCWSFLEQFLSDDYNLGRRVGSSTPINKAAFEEQARLEMIPILERDFSKGVELREMRGNGGSSWTVYSPEEIDMEKYGDYALTEAEVAQLRAAIEGAVSLTTTDEQIMAIINEEAGAFRAGAKSAEETAKMIQSRVSLYVSEKN